VLEIEHEFSFEELRIRLSESHRPAKIASSRLFSDYAQQLIDELIETNKAGNALVYQVAVKRFNKFTNNPKLRFTDINYNLLESYKRQLMKDGVKQNTISNYFRTLRAIYNKAVKAKLVDKSHYPFLDIPIKTERTAKRALDLDSLQKFAKHELKPKSRRWHARNYFLLSFSLIGASFTDLAYLTEANIKKGRVVYRRRKTGQELSIKLQTYAEQILTYYKGSNEKYLLPILPANVIEDGMKAKYLIMQAIKQTNRHLNNIAEACKIESDVTTYVARHSWATTAKRLGYSIELIAEALGHEHGNKITNIYLDSFDQSLIDEVNAKVIDLLQ
jgi:integrase/recombinase XerD